MCVHTGRGPLLPRVAFASRLRHGGSAVSGISSADTRPELLAATRFIAPVTTRYFAGGVSTGAGVSGVGLDWAGAATGWSTAAGAICTPDSPTLT